MSKTITDNQRAAIQATGNVLVLAGAGSGKTSTLVERCLYHVLHPAQPVSVTEMLIVTFTDAAAAEVRKRLRERLESARSTADAAAAMRLEREIALIESAHICTLHSFCLHLVRQHFHEAGLDPSLVVLREEQASVFIETALNGLMERHFQAGATKEAERVQHLIEIYAAGDEARIRTLVLKLHNYTQTLANPARWFSEQIASLQEESPRLWRTWLTQALMDWCDRWGKTLEPLAENRFASQFCSRVKAARAANPAEFAALFADVVNAIDPIPWGFAPHRDAIHDFFEEAAFFQSLLQKSEATDPLAEDWEWVRGPIETLLRLTQEFSGEYARLKRDHAAVDFHDLEQFALDLLTGKERTSLTGIAHGCRRQFKLVFVDEYQDINAAQDAILGAMAREGAEANRFLVGDIKQSIYRFRLADPTIFQTYNARWRQSSDGRVIPLAENFRSAAPILQFVNSVFDALMHHELGGVDYDSEAHLRPGPTDRPHPTDPCVEVHLRLTEKEEPREDEEPEENATEIELEARMVARVLRQLHDAAHPIWDHNEKKNRPASWRDMVVLLRSPRGRAEIFLKEFRKAGVPLAAPRGGLYDSAEVSDLLSLLRLLDNPLQDVPLLAVLRSPLVGLSLDELAAMRAKHPAGLFWAALNAWHRARPTATLDDYSMWTKVDLFLQRFNRWRKMGRQTALSERLECMLRETQYLEWLLTQSRPAQRQANVRRFIEFAGQFDPMQRQGLQRFLRFVDAQRDAEADNEPDSPEGVDTVRLMSIHQSKGLEFPVVALAGLGVQFNFRDLGENILLDEHYGLCAHVKPPGFGSSYPSLPWWLARRRQRRETLGEELRLLYVALTRARDTLLLFGSASRKAAEKWPEAGHDLAAIEDARSPLQWLGPRYTQHAGVNWCSAPEGTTDLFRWRLHKDTEAVASAPVSPEKPAMPPDPAKFAELVQRLEWKYPWPASARESAKVSVTALRHANEEAELRFHKRSAFRTRRDPSKLRAAEVGTAHHIFLQSIELQNAASIGALRDQMITLVQQQVLSPEQAKAIDLDAIAAFWGSPLGQEILADARSVHREIPFSGRFTRGDFIAAQINTELPEGEFVIVQGTVDLAVIRPEEMWIVDFKTDALDDRDLQAASDNYAPQLRIYASALSRIYKRPVTKRWLHFLSLNKTVSL